MVCKSLFKSIIFVRSFSKLATTPSSSKQLLKMTEESITFYGFGSKRVIQIDRPEALNAMNGRMFDKMNQLLETYEQDPDVSLVIIKGNEKAFCSGGDVKALTTHFRDAKTNHPMHYNPFLDLMHTINFFSKPYISLIDGITFGGGCGIAMNGNPIVVATERTLVSMPEVHIGFYPDSCAAHFYKESLGMFLGLTGHRLKGADVYHAGLATNYVNSSNLTNVEQEILSLPEDHANSEGVQEILDSFQEKELPEFSLKSQLSEIKEHFSESSLEAIFESLKSSKTDFAQKVLKDLKKLPPLSLKITFKHFKEADKHIFDELLALEKRLTINFLKSYDFHEGVRALLVDKDRNPKWKPATLEEATEDLVDSYFKPFEDPKFEWKPKI